jgi:hypothetical protein
MSEIIDDNEDTSLSPEILEILEKSINSETDSDGATVSTGGLVRKPPSKRIDAELLLKHVLLTPEKWIKGQNILRICNLKIVGTLYLRNRVIRCHVRFENCIFDNLVMAEAAKTHSLSFIRCDLPGFNGHDMRVNGRLLFVEAKKIFAEVDLRGAKIDNDLSFSKCRFAPNHNQSNENTGIAVNCEFTKIGGSFIFRSCNTKNRQIVLLGANIKGDLLLDGAELEGWKGGQDVNGRRDFYALDAGSSKIGGDVNLITDIETDRIFNSIGGIRFRNAKVGGDFRIVGANIECTNKSLNLSGSVISGRLFMNKSFSFKGDVHMKGAEVKGALRIKNGTFESTINASRARLRSSLRIHDDVVINGSLILSGSTVIGNIEILNTTINAKPKKDTDAYAIKADRIQHFGHFKISSKFYANGQLTFEGANISGDLDCRGIRISVHKSKSAIWARNITIGGNLNLNKHDDINLLDITGRVILTGACVEGSLFIRNGTILSDYAGKKPVEFAINLELAVIKKNLSLGGDPKVGGDPKLASELTLEGSVGLVGAKILGKARFAGLFIKKQQNAALKNMYFMADNIEVDGNLVFGGKDKEDHFDFECGLKMRDSVVHGIVEIKNGEIRSTDTAIDFSRSKFSGTFDIGSEFSSVGEIYLKGIDIAGDLRLQNCRLRKSLDKIKTPSKDAVYYRMTNATIGGHLHFLPGFKAEDGAFSLRGIKVMGNVYGGLRNNGHTTGSSSQGKAKDSPENSPYFHNLIFEYANIDGSFLWHDVDIPEGGTINLSNAKVGSLDDQAEGWPDGVELILDGFEYGNIVGGNYADSDKKIEWLRKQKKAHLEVDFRPQPWGQLAECLRAKGHVRSANKILIARERHRIKANAIKAKPIDKRYKLFKSNFQLIKNKLWSFTDYGYSPQKSLYGMLFMWVVGTITFSVGHQFDLIVPADPRLYLDDRYVENEQWKIDEYPKFQALVYSLDTLVPVLNLHQEENWHPATRTIPAPSGKAQAHAFAEDCTQSNTVINWLACPRNYLYLLKYYTWLHIIMGWILTTVAIISFSGVFRKK